MPFLKVGNLFDDVTFRQFRILPWRFIKRSGENNFRRISKLFAGSMFRVVRIRSDFGPMRDKSFGKFSTKDDAVNRIRQLIDKLFQILVPIPNHPIRFTVRAGDKPINTCLDLQFQFSHISPRSVGIVEPHVGPITFLSKTRTLDEVSQHREAIHLSISYLPLHYSYNRFQEPQAIYHYA